MNYISISASHWTDERVLEWIKFTKQKIYTFDELLYGGIAEDLLLHHNISSK